MELVQIFIPLYDGQGKPFARSLYARERKKLTERFGGLTAYMQAPARGLWKDGGKTKRDDLVIFEVMVPRLKRAWWTKYRRSLERTFKQKELLVRLQKVKLL